MEQPTGNGTPSTAAVVIQAIRQKLFYFRVVNNSIIITIAGIAVNETHLTATGIHMSMGSHGITRDLPAIIPADAGTRFIYQLRMKG